MKTTADASRPPFTPRQGQFLAFIHAYTLVNGRPPAEANMMRFFQLTPPSVHQIVLTLERAGLMSRGGDASHGYRPPLTLFLYNSIWDGTLSLPGPIHRCFHVSVSSARSDLTGTIAGPIP